VHWLKQLEDSQLPVGSVGTQLGDSSSISKCVMSDKTGRYSIPICVRYNTTWNIHVASGLTQLTTDFYGLAEIPHITSTQTGVLPGFFFFGLCSYIPSRWLAGGEGTPHLKYVSSIAWPWSNGPFTPGQCRAAGWKSVPRCTCLFPSSRLAVWWVGHFGTIFSSSSGAARVH
jgi:hypothetical protein